MSHTSRAINDDTIVALATPAGRGAIAVIRLSGPRAHEIAASVIHPWPSTARRAQLSAAIDQTGALLDRPIVTVFDAPRSYTGEPVVEIASHGGAIVPTSIITALVAAGARPAEPGEFTRRAVLNGRIDLAQAEAIGDLVDARSGAMQRAAIDQLDGGLSRRILALRDALVELEALLAYDIDFPEEDAGPIPPQRIRDAARAATERLDALVTMGEIGELIRDGAIVVIAGAPNVGKSSLFNALLGRARALVTDIPGTTRDAIEAVIEPTGAPAPIRLVDTAGLREYTDAIERLGIEVSFRYLASAHVVLACGETGSAVATAISRIRPHTSATTRIIGVRTKSDLAASDAVPEADVSVSAETGAGLHQLLDRISAVLREQLPALDAPVILRARHRDALAKARVELARFREAWEAGEVPAVVAAASVRSAIAALESIIGAVGVDDVLDRVFSEFCVGK